MKPPNHTSQPHGWARKCLLWILTISQSIRPYQQNLQTRTCNITNQSASFTEIVCYTLVKSHEWKNLMHKCWRIFDRLCRAFINIPKNCQDYINLYQNDVCIRLYSIFGYDSLSFTVCPKDMYNIVFSYVCSNVVVVCLLTHLPLDKMAAISQTTFSNTFSWMKSLVFRFKFHWSLFPRVLLTISQHWFR